MIDQLLLDLLLQRLEEKYPGAQLDAIGHARLCKEATKIKVVLSANKETVASLESLVDGKDFRIKVTRTEMEALIKPHVARITSPIQKILDESGILFLSLNKKV